MERYAFPCIGRLPVSKVNTADVLEILTPIWQSRQRRYAPEGQRIRSVLEAEMNTSPLKLYSS